MEPESLGFALESLDFAPESPDFAPESLDFAPESLGFEASLDFAAPSPELDAGSDPEPLRESVM
ncbi:MAG TPA: hypothetical protein VFE70_05520 [Candidatus Elarobacter sp.]|nr:hypothetical protein [Candidatus Elarobacter sp.]